MKQQKKLLLPTLKINVKRSDLNAIAFGDKYAVQYEIIGIKNNVETKFGTKQVLELSRSSDGFRLCCFINDKSLNNLIEAFGEEDADWVGKLVNLSKEQSEGFDNEMIVVTPVE